MDETPAQPDERFSALYAEHADALVALCRRMVGLAEAEEIAQEAFLRAWVSWDRYSPDRPFWPWLATIARRLCIDRGRRHNHATALAHKAASIFDGIPVVRPEEFVEAAEEYSLARAAVAELRPDHRRMLTRQAVDGWSYAQIADAEGVSEEAVRGVLRRARTGLRMAYARVAGSAPVVAPLAALRWARRRIATVPQLDMNALRAGEAAFAAAAALAIGVTPGAAASSAPSAVNLLSAAPVAASRPAVTDAASSTHTPPAPAARLHTNPPVPSAGATPASTVPTRPPSVKLAEIKTDDEYNKMCAEADVDARVAGHGACVNTKTSMESAKIIIETGRVEP